MGKPPVVSVPKPGIEPGTFRSSVWRSPNWAISAAEITWLLFDQFVMFQFLMNMISLCN